MSDFRISQVAASPSMTEPSTSGSERKLDRPAVVLGARSICKSFGRRAAAHQVLFDVDVDVYEGECLAVIGGSGSGKSTLTRIMLGLGTPMAALWSTAARRCCVAAPVCGGCATIPD